MPLIIYIISLISYFIILCLRKRLGFIYYQLAIAIVYLFSLSYIQTLDVTLIFYSIFSSLPYLKYFSIKNNISVFFFIYFSLIILYSTIINGVTDALSIFIIRLIGIIYYNYIFNHIKYDQTKREQPTHNKDKHLLIIFLTGELILTTIGVILSGGFGRLMLNYQCTVGNISICGILICGSALNSIKKQEKKSQHLSQIFFIWLLILIFTFLSIFSGTRGYIIVCLGMSLIYIVLFLTRFTKILIFLILALPMIMFGDSIVEHSIDNLGFKNSTGRRSSENQFVIQYMPNSPIHMLFGYGFGKKVKTLPDYTSYIHRVADTSYTNYILPEVSGFHNLYITIYYSSGIIGLATISLMFFYIISTLLKNSDKKLAIILVSYIILYMILLWFRWTATSGILEFATLQYIIMKDKKHEK